MQGVWSQIQLQGHFIPGPWLSHITSQETGPTRRETVKSETGELTWRQTTTGGRGARYYLTFVPRAFPSKIRRAGKGRSRIPWQTVRFCFFFVGVEGGGGGGGGGGVGGSKVSCLITKMKNPHY